MCEIKDIDVQTLKDLLDQKNRLILVDVRDPEEFEICNINGSILIPLVELEEHLPDFDKDIKFVVYCKEGERSLKAAKIMSKYGFKDIYNVEGGITDWAKRIDRRMEMY